MQNITSSTIICPQCAGENQISVDDRFIECTFCSSAIYVDKSKVVTHYVVSSNFNKDAAEGNLRRWMAGNFQVKDLDKLAQISKLSFYYFPMWYFKTADASGDKIYLQPATSTSISEIKKISIPAGNLKVFHKKEFDEKDFMTPDIYLTSAQKWLTDSGVDLNSTKEASLVHIPFYQFTYVFNGSEYTALVEASSGKVYANLWPKKSETPYRMIFGIGVALYLIISIAALIISAATFDSGGEVASGSIIFKLFFYALASIPLFIIAFIIAKKV
jgi:hypothetical protein